MLLRTRKVTAPDGTEHQVSVDWHTAHVKLPSAWRRRPKEKAEGSSSSSSSGSDWTDVCDCGVCDDFAIVLLVLLAFILAGLLLWFLIWPLLALAVELLIALLAVLFAAMFRVAFGRPWIIEVEAEGLDRECWAVRGIGPTDRAMQHIADALHSGLPPRPVDATKL